MIFIPRNKCNTGGSTKKEQAVTSHINKSGRSRAKYAGKPNEPDWIHEGEDFKGEPARQCVAEDGGYKYCTTCDTRYSALKKLCPECGSGEYFHFRCKNCAEPGKETCRSHGGTHVLTKEQSDKCKIGSMTNGLTVAQVLFCTEKCVISEFCPNFQVLVDVERYGSTVPRCLPEQLMYDAIIDQFKKEYELDDVADQMMLHSLAITLVRKERGEKILSAQGELTDRIKRFADGSVETYQTPNAISSVVDNLDKRQQAWLKELQVSKAAREGKKVQVTGNINLTNLLSNPANAKIIDEDQIIDVELDEDE